MPNNTEIIYGVEITLPDIPPSDQIENWGESDPTEQFWRRKPLPDFFKKANYDAEGNIVWTKEQYDFAQDELRKIREGFWFYNNGKPTYITGRNYYYLQYWILENGKKPEYRDTSRRYFLYIDHWRNSPWCRGVLRGKSRRSGATSESTSNMTYAATTIRNSKVGIVSKTSADARKVFIYRIQFGFRHLPAFLQPTLANDKDSKSELVFSVPIDRTKKNARKNIVDEVEGLNSMIDYQPTALNSYDSERLTDGLIDETGKFPVDVPADQFLSIIGETLFEGAEKIGFLEIPTTVNEVTKKGGAAFKRMWEAATWVKELALDDDDEIDEDEDESTANGFVRFFIPAFDGLSGFVGKYGESIIDAPTPAQAQYLKDRYGEAKFKTKKYGAKAFLERRRAKLRDAALEEEIRKYPFNEIEMFMSANTNCHFNQVKILKQREYLAETNYRPRRVTFYRNMEQKVMWRDDENGYWLIAAFPPTDKANKLVSGKPGNTEDYVMGVDSYSNSQGGRKYGSLASAFVYRKFDINDPENSGLFTAMYLGRPRTKELLHEQVLLCAEHFGCLTYYEHTADDYKTYFTERGKLNYLGMYPMNAIDPNKRDKTERFRGFPINPFAMTKQLDSMIAYVEEYCHKIYFDILLDQLLLFEAENRTSSDAVVAAMIALVSGLDTKPQQKPVPKPLVKTYENPKYSKKNFQRLDGIVYRPT